MNVRKRYTILFSAGLLIVLSCMLGTISIQAANTQKIKEQRILFLSSYSYAWSSVPPQIDGIRDVIDKSVILDYKFMDTKSVNDVKSMQLFHDSLKYYLSKVKPYDVIIVGDDAAFYFAVEYKDELFPNSPVVFEGINDLKYAIETGQREDFTGVLEDYDYKSNIELGKKLYKNAKRVVAVSDGTVSGRAESEQFFSYADEYPELKFEELNTSLYTYNEICSKIAEFDEDTIVLYLLFGEDKDGNRYTIRHASEMFAEYCRVPAFRLMQDGIGEGMFGGRVVSLKDTGRIAGKMAMEILNGTPAGCIPVMTKCPYSYYFDYQVMKKYNIKREQLPQNAVFIHEDKTYWQLHSELIMKILMISLVSILFAGVIVLIIFLRFRVRMARKLHEKNMQLLDTLEELEKSNQDKTLFLTRLSHEIRTPMDGILNMTMMLKNEGNNSEKALHYLDKIGDSSRILLDIINDVLDLSAIENKKIAIAQEEFELNEILASLSDTYMKLCNQKGVLFLLETFGLTEQKLIGDSMRLRQMLGTLLSAGLAFTDRGGQVKLVVREKEKNAARVYLEFAVIDTGIGMNEAKKERLFKPFAQEDSRDNLQHGGLGVQMLVTKGLVELMDGMIRVESEEREGTTIMISLPFAYTSSDNL